MWPSPTPGSDVWPARLTQVDTVPSSKRCTAVFMKRAGACLHAASLPLSIATSLPEADWLAAKGAFKLGLGSS